MHNLAQMELQLKSTDITNAARLELTLSPPLSVNNIVNLLTYFFLTQTNTALYRYCQNPYFRKFKNQRQDHYPEVNKLPSLGSDSRALNPRRNTPRSGNRKRPIEDYVGTIPMGLKRLKKLKMILCPLCQKPITASSQGRLRRKWDTHLARFHWFPKLRPTENVQSSEK